MEQTAVDGEPAEPSGTLSGEKRPIENGGDSEFSEPLVSKKTRKDPELGRNLRRVAEIVLVMSAMATVRGGKKPSDAEVELMAEARAKLVEICEGLAPKDIVGREAIGSVIEDLGLNVKAKDQKLGFRGPRLTITEKLAQAKRKMEESKKYIAPLAYGSHPAQTNFSPSVESRGAVPTVRMFPSDKPSHVPTSMGGVTAPLPPGHVSTAGSASIHQLPSNEGRAHIISSGIPINHQGKDSSSFLHRPERPLHGTYGSHTQANSSVNHAMASVPTWSAPTQSAPSAKSGPEHKLSNHTAVSAQVITDSSTLRSTSQTARDQGSRPPISQTVTGNLPGLQSPLQGLNFVQAPPLSNNHNEIAKIIQKLIQPQLPDHPTWTPPSRDYMNKAVTCQTCQVTINEVDSVLICDACEKGYHLKCVQSPNQRAIPRGEWHCPKCLSISHGKPLPPKYGRVMRSNPPPKVSLNTSGAQLSEKRFGAMDLKANASQLKFVSNGGSDLQSPQHVDQGSNTDELSGFKIQNDEGEINENHFVPTCKDIHEKPTSTSLNNSDKSSGPPCGSGGPSSAELPSEKSVQHTTISESPKGEKGSSESKAEPPEVSGIVPDKFNGSEPTDTSQIVEHKSVPNGTEKPYSMTSAPSTEERDDNETLQVNDMENLEVSETNGEQSGTSSEDLRGVEWIGNVAQFMDSRAYYKSCRVDGVTYNVQDFALFPSIHGKLTPFRLQSMYWGDSETESKRAVLRRCYFPDDLPENVIPPSPPEPNEVYVSDSYDCQILGLIRGPCDILSVSKFKEENERRSQLDLGGDSGTKPVFLCKWSYDSAHRQFTPFSS